MEERVTENKTQIDHINYYRNHLNGYSKATQKILDLCLEYIDYCKKLYQDGRNVVWTLTNAVSCVLSYGNGYTPASITEIGRLGSYDSVKLAEEFFQVPNETCAMVKSDMGEFYLQKGEIANRLFYTGSACEPYNQAFEVLKDYGYDVHVNDIGFRPAGNRERYDDMVSYAASQLYDTIKWLTGKEPDLDRMREEMLIYNNIQKKVRKILSLRLEHPTYIGSLPTMILIMGHCHYFGKREEYEKALDDLTEELENLPKGSYHDEKVVLAWSGSRGQEFSIFETIDEAKGAILAWNLPDNIVNEFDLTIDPLEALALFEVGDVHAGTTKQSSENFIHSVKKCNVKGIVMYTYLGCSFYTIDIELRRKFFKEQGIPSLTLLGAFDIGSVSGQVSTRIRAFIEMLTAKSAGKKDDI
jgi:benzoyl-CoA reductase/2-hydroxyglutaryl-CoA dehydratase subunit BcrC/BadD/HgdB